jgi:hypothetical protein
VKDEQRRLQGLFDAGLRTRGPAAMAFCSHWARFAVAQAVQRRDPCSKPAGYLANVGRKGVRRSMKERASGRTEIF